MGMMCLGGGRKEEEDEYQKSRSRLEGGRAL